MEYLLETTGTIEDGVGFALFGTCHLLWLAGFVLFAAAASWIYRRLGTSARRWMRVGMAAAIVVNELFKMAVLFIGGNYTVNYLPLHLCSINLFLIAWHCVRPSRTLDNYLYVACIPAALAALLFPSWTGLPPTSLMHIHSFTFHILLATYPIMLLASGEIRPRVSALPKVLLLLACLAGVAALANALLGTNFMFLTEADAGNPLYWFEENWGSHLWGFAVILPAVVLVMYAPELLHSLWKKRHPCR